MIASHTPTGPIGTCDICLRPFGHYEGLQACPECGADHCNACMNAADKRGAVSFDVDGTTWHVPCLLCGTEEDA